jgi:hypothetical protein
MRFIYIITIIFILSTQVVFSNLYAGQSNNLTTVKCYGNILIEVGAKQNITAGEYSFVDCDNYDLNKWSCLCNDGNEQTIKIFPKKGNTNKYNVKINYYIQPKLEVPEYDIKTELPPKEQIENDMNLRKKSFVNLQVGEAPAKSLPLITNDVWTFLIGIGIFILLIFGFILYKGYKYVMKDYNDDRMYTYQNKKDKEVGNNKDSREMNDKEILEYFRNNSK